MCAKLEMMQNEQEKKKGNEEEWLNALVREHVEKLAQQLEEEDAKLQGYQQSLEEWLKRGQREFKRTITEKVDEFIHASETKVTTVLEKCEEVARLQEHQQSLEEWLKRSQREFNKKLAEKVDKLKQESETKVTIVGELHGHGATQPCIQAKSTRHPRGCVGQSPTIFFYYFFPVKIT